MTEFEAKHPGVCAGCEEFFDRGELVRYVDDRIEHVECIKVAPLREVCTECFTEKSVSGECLCIG